jgi:hypothetical protein
MTMGRPVKWNTPAEFEIAGNQYFLDCNNSDPPRHYTVAGLALALDLSYQGLNEYEAKPDFSAIVKRLKTRVLAYCLEKSYGNNAAGPIFQAKHLGMPDKNIQEISGPNGGVIPIGIDITFINPHGQPDQG